MIADVVAYLSSRVSGRIWRASVLSTHMEFKKVSELCKLAVQILIDSVEALLKLLLRKFTDWVMCGVVIHVW